jgi:hypothetical protein
VGILFRNKVNALLCKGFVHEYDRLSVCKCGNGIAVMFVKAATILPKFTSIRTVADNIKHVGFIFL